MKKILSLILAVCISTASAFATGASALGNAKIKRADSNFEFARISADIVYLYNENTSGNSEQSVGGAMRIIGRTTDCNYNFRRLGADEGVVGNDGRFLLQFNDYSDFKYAMNTLSADDKIIYAERDALVNLCASQQAETPSLSWGVEALGLDKYSQYISEKYSDSQGVTVAIVDTGVEDVDYVKDRLVAGYDFVENDEDAFEDTSEDSHGTFLASIVKDCTEGAPVSIMPVRVMESKEAYISSVINGIYYAVDNGADVINLSIIVVSGPCVSLHDAIDYAEENDVVFVSSAGNFKRDTANVCPAHLDSVIAVSAVDSNLDIASYSNFGDEIDYAAPGSGIVGYGADGNLKTLNGTSMSAAFISAASALFLIDNPSCTPSQMRYSFDEICNDFGDEGFDVFYGNGIPDFSKLIGNAYVPVTGIEVMPKNISLIKGNVWILGYDVYPSDASNKSVTYSSSNPSVAYVVNGHIYCVSEGVTVITVKTVDGGFSDSMTLTVVDLSSQKPEPVSLVVIASPDKTNYTYKSNEKLDLSGICLTVIYSDSSSKSYANPQNIVVDYDSFSTAKAGKQKISFEYEGLTGEFEITVSYTWWQTLIRIILLGFLWY